MLPGFPQPVLGGRGSKRGLVSFSKVILSRFIWGKTAGTKVNGGTAMKQGGNSEKLGLGKLERQ